jgi:hypothetical protein
MNLFNQQPKSVEDNPTFIRMIHNMKKIHSSADRKKTAGQNQSSGKIVSLLEREE